MRLLAIALLLGGCGGRPTNVCPEEEHLADPDGRGERCIDDRSSCDSPGDCTTADACCEAACADADGSGVFECSEVCREPACSEGTCPVGMLCQPGLDACSALCVPDDVECPPGQILADPSGTGTFECVRDDSGCLAPSECPVLEDGCCTSACIDSGGGLFVCDEVCMDGGPSDGSEDEDWASCWTDNDCALQTGPGSRCMPGACGNPNYCVPPAACVSDDDCTLAIDASLCCACPEVVPREVLDGTTCWVEQPYGMDHGDSERDPAPPADDCIPACVDADCPAVDCAEPLAIECQQGACRGVY